MMNSLIKGRPAITMIHRNEYNQFEMSPEVRAKIDEMTDKEFSAAIETVKDPDLRFFLQIARRCK